MTDPEVAAVDAVLQRHGIRYVVVGGQAVARTAATTTHDVDVMVATDDFEKSIAALRTEKDLVPDWAEPNLARFRILSAAGLPLDILNSSVFAGTKTGREFFEFLLEGASRDDHGILYSTPEAVWYTRLLTKRWKAYAEKIITNVIDGVAPDRLRQVEEIAARFGTESIVETRLAYVRGELARPDVRSLIRSS